MDVKRTKTEARTIAQRRADAEARARAQIDAQQRAILRQHAEALLIALDKIMVRGHTFVLDTFADLLCGHVWVVDAQGAIHGHILTVDEAVAVDATDWLVLTIPEALAGTWRDDAERHAWSGAYVDALRRIADEQEGREQALTDRAELLRVVDQQRRTE